MKSSDWIWDQGRRGEQLTLEQREKEFQSAKTLFSLMRMDHLRMARARLGDLLLNGADGHEELIALRRRLIEEEIGRREKKLIRNPWVTDQTTSERCISALTSIPIQAGGGIIRQLPA